MNVIKSCSTVYLYHLTSSIRPLHNTPVHLDSLGPRIARKHILQNVLLARRPRPSRLFPHRRAGNRRPATRHAPRTGVRRRQTAASSGKLAAHIGELVVRVFAAAEAKHRAEKRAEGGDAAHNEADSVLGNYTLINVRALSLPGEGDDTYIPRSSHG